jgi:hypothetical protein
MLTPKDRVMPPLDTASVAIKQRKIQSPHTERIHGRLDSLKRWPELTRFLEDSRLCMSNNAAGRDGRAPQLDLRRF